MKISFKLPFSSAALIAGAVLFLGSCATTRTTFDPKDLSYLYNPLKNNMNPRYGVFNDSESRSVISVKLFAAELFFSEANPAGVPMAQMFIAVRLYNLSYGRTVADTAFYDLSIVKEAGKDEYVYQIPLRVRKDTEYMAEIKTGDKLRQVIIQAFVPFNTLSDFNRYNFYARGHNGKNTILKPVVRRDEYFNIVYGRSSPDSIYISLFPVSEDIPFPPSMLLPERSIPSKPDTVVALPYSDTLPLMLPGKGIFLFRASRDVEEGFTLFNFGENFPSMAVPAEMLKPLNYIIPKSRVDSMATAMNPKMALDNFWLECGGGNVEKARELIRIFYTRTIFANYYFTSWREGWQTDRGMIYIIYGPPDKLYKSNDSESWGYRKPVINSRWGPRYSVREDYVFFTFKKRENRFTDNDYTLSRGETLVSFWDQAVQSWRKGIVFRLDNPEGI